MANRNFPQARQWGFHLMPVRIDANISIGSSGAPTVNNALGINSITRLSAGVYQIQLQDNYPDLIGFKASFISPVTSSSAVNMGSLVTSTIYQIITLGTSTQAQWVAAGVPAGITAAPGVVFKAAGAGAGNGTVKVLSVSGIATTELIGQPADIMLSNQPFQAMSGGYITFQCLAPTDSSTTTLIPTDPANGSIMLLEIILNNSNVQ